MNQVVESLQSIAESHGAKFHFSKPISHVATDPTGQRANGIYLASSDNEKTKSKTKIPADIVIVNADLAYAHNNLFLKDGQSEDRKKGELKEPRLAKSLRGKKHSCSSISFYWAMDRVLEKLKAHNIFLVSIQVVPWAWPGGWDRKMLIRTGWTGWVYKQAEEYEESFDDIFKKSDMPREPSFYVNVPSRMWA
jgi:phytoene desaturase (3,4-didehydrolycopene-forming)